MKKLFTAIAAASVCVSMQASAVSYAPHVKMGAPQVSDEIIEDTPEGKLTWLDRTCDGFVTKAFEATHGIVRGSIVQRVDGEDGYVYLSHMASEYPVNTWTRFEKQGDTLVMEGVQAIYMEYDDWYEEEFIVYLAPMEVVIDENNRGTFVVNDDCRYVLNVGEDGSLTAADPSMILGVCVQTLNADLTGNDIWIWKGFGDRDVKMTPASGELLTLPEGVKTEDWVMNDGLDRRFVQVAIDGEDFYVNGTDSSLPEAWIKGRIADGKVTFPSGQYLGADMEIYYYSYFCGAEFSTDVNEEGEEIMVASLAPSAIFDYDTEKQLLTLERGYVVNSTSDILYPLYFYDDVTIGVQHRDPDAAPAEPYDVFYFTSEWDSKIWFQVPNVDVNGDILKTDRLYYEIYVNDELLSFAIEDEDWNVEETSLVPYKYQDYDIYVEGPDHTVYIYEPNVESIAIRSVYINENDEEVYSEFAYWGEENGVEGIEGGKATVSVKWYDLQGREIRSGAKGVAVKVSTYSDGTSVRTKVMKR